MVIPVVHEDPFTVETFGNLIEQCHFCKTPTRYWHENTNNPVCQNCAKTHKVAELPDHGQAIRANKRKKKGKELQPAPSESAKAYESVDDIVALRMKELQAAAAARRPRMRKPTKKDRLHSLTRRTVENAIELVMLQSNVDRKEACAKIKQLVNEVANAGFSS